MRSFVLCLLAATAWAGELKHKVTFRNTPIALEAVNEYLDTPGFQILNLEKPYLCYTPLITKTFEPEVNSSATPDGELLATAITYLGESFSTDKCVFLFGVNGEYWTFGYCFGDKIIQFHHNLEHYLLTKTFKPEYPNFVFTLGQFKRPHGTKPPAIKLIENQLQWDPNENNLQMNDFSIIDDFVNPFLRGINLVTKNGNDTFQKLVQHTLKDGDVCDLTGYRRTIDIIYKCDASRSPTVQILNAQEIKSCEYQMIIHVPKLCEIPEFQPPANDEEIVEMTCREVVEEPQQELEVDNSIGVQSNMGIEDATINKQLHFLFPVEKYPLAGKELFPIDHDFKITISDYQLIPFGDGFYTGLSKEPIESDNNYFKFRHVLIYNGIYSLDSNKEHTLRAFGEVLSNAIERSLLAPVTSEGRKQQGLVMWADSFVVWFELYNHVGEFINLVRVERDGTLLRHTLTLNYVDPSLMINDEGQPVIIEDFEGPNMAMNYQYYHRAGKKRRRKNREKEGAEVVVETLTVTVTAVKEATTAMATDTAYLAEVEGDVLDIDVFEGSGIEEREQEKIPNQNENGIDNENGINIEIDNENEIDNKNGIDNENDNPTNENLDHNEKEIDNGIDVDIDNENGIEIDIGEIDGDIDEIDDDIGESSIAGEKSAELDAQVHDEL